MSPEQARGQPADKRSDVWAFGCVLDEMLTGRRAFEGKDVAEILGAVLKTEPDWTRLRADTPPPVRRLLGSASKSMRRIGGAMLPTSASTSSRRYGSRSVRQRQQRRPHAARALRGLLPP